MEIRPRVHNNYHAESEFPIKQQLAPRHQGDTVRLKDLQAYTAKGFFFDHETTPEERDALNLPLEGGPDYVLLFEYDGNNPL
jgi:hypothetical protein